MSRNPRLRLVAFARLASVTGRWAATVALAVVVFRRGGAEAVIRLGVIRILPAAAARLIAAGLLGRGSAATACCSLPGWAGRSRSLLRALALLRGHEPRARVRARRRGVAPLDDGPAAADRRPAVPGPDTRRADRRQPDADDDRELGDAVRPARERTAPVGVDPGVGAARDGRRLCLLDVRDRSDTSVGAGRHLRSCRRRLRGHGRRRARDPRRSTTPADRRALLRGEPRRRLPQRARGIRLGAPVAEPRRFGSRRSQRRDRDRRCLRGHRRRSAARPPPGRRRPRVRARALRRSDRPRWRPQPDRTDPCSCSRCSVPG